MPEPTLSVVIASWPNARGLDKCLESLRPQRETADEVFVVGSEAPARELVERFPWVCWLIADPNQLVPHLWAQGIGRARGDVIAITTGQFIPAADWLRVIRESHTRLASPAIGGGIDPARGGSAVAWAGYFIRYSAYAGLDREEALTDLAGDNASYKRRALEAHPECVNDGFWEQTFHRVLLREGATLSFVPQMRVALNWPFGFRDFLRQRFRHGRQFGADRVRERGGGYRFLAIAGSPLVPLILLSKLVGRIVRSRRDLVPLAMALPCLACFSVAWAFGEGLGYLAPSSASESARGVAR